MMNSPSLEMAWKISRPKPALPSSYLWTWDHSANWMLDDPGVLNFGCSNRYLKRPETFIEDYRRLTDFAAGLGIIEEIIRPRDTRKRIAALLGALKDKAETRLPKKHNNIPL